MRAGRDPLFFRWWHKVFEKKKKKKQNLSDWKNIEVERFRAVEISTRKISIKKEVASTVRLNITAVTETRNLRKE